MSALNDKGDKLLRNSLYAAALKLKGVGVHHDFIKKVEEECRINTLFRQRKSADYKWSDSGSENPEENTLWKRPTYWLYKKFGLNFYKGLNGDQLRAYYIWCYLNRSNYRIVCIKHLAGFIFRLGFFPNLQDHILFKPHTIILLLATIFNPLKYLVYPFWKFSMKRNLRTPISECTTNKISLLVAMKLLLGKEKTKKIIVAETGYNLEHYVTRVYETYFSPITLRFLGAALIEGVLK